VTFTVLAAETMEYHVTLVADGAGRVSWKVSYGEGQKMRLFSCDPRPAVDRKNECIHGGVPKPLFGTLVGDIAAELEDGGAASGVRAVRFEHAPGPGG
jgi:hypothetical protein